MPRNYRREYDMYYGVKGRPELWSKAQVKHRKEKSNRNGARAIVTRRDGARRVKNRDVHHVNGNQLDNRPSNLQITTINYNRKRNAHSTKRRARRKARYPY